MGYKYVTDEISWHNFDVYLEKAQSGEVLHAYELEKTAGYLDKEECSGIYFCESLDELYHWVDELLDHIEVRCLNIVEVLPVSEVQKRVYDDGRTAFVADSVRVRLLSNLPPKLQQLIDSV